MKQLILQFVAVDDWNRPIFKDGKGRYFGDTENLFNYGADKDEVYSFYRGKQLNEPEYRKKVMRLGRVKSDADVKKVVVRYVVDVNGKIRDTKIVRSEGSEYDKKALDIILGMPDWIPAQHEGKTVASYFTLMICFDLD